MKTKLKIKTGDVIRYDDGRKGHNATARVLSVSDLGMVVQFTDRADTTSIRFSESAWMKYITVDRLA